MAGYSGENPYAVGAGVSEGFSNGTNMVAEPDADPGVAIGTQGPGVSPARSTGGSGSDELGNATVTGGVSEPPSFESPES